MQYNDLMSTEPSMELYNQISGKISSMSPNFIIGPKDSENTFGNESKNFHGSSCLIHIPFNDQQSTNLDNLLRIESSPLSLKVQKQSRKDNASIIPFPSTMKVDYDNSVNNQDSETTEFSANQILCHNSVTSSEDNNESNCLLDGISYYPQGVFCPIDTKWQKEKCKLFKLTFVGGMYMRISQL